ncbi:MAG: hypothetical protein LBK94_10840 [Prevotellaceae bacterium]|jgi:hypothetical protein|nr:hypothetical protein [Prevotellaceae bacterium]
MCWSILYHENKISPEETIADYNIYNKVNILENLNCTFQINKIYIQNKLYYNITKNQCACDFFNLKNTKLRDEFINLILTRMEIPCIEPCIYIKWIENNDGINNIPNNVININENKLLTIYTKEYKEAYYCIKRTNE